MSKLLYILISCFVFCSVVFAADPEDLDELVSRKIRRTDNTWGYTYLEDSSNNYIWNAETVAYYDKTTGNEVWKLTNPVSSEGSFLHNSIAKAQWSANGNRIALTVTRDTGAYSKDPADGRIWFVTNTDGSRFRPIINAATREYWASKSPFLNWSSAEVDVYYDFGNNKHGWAGDITHLYRVEVSDNGETRTDYLTFPEACILQNTISGDGLKVLGVSRDELTLYPATIYPSGSKGLDDNDGYTSNRPHGANDTERQYWGDTPITITTWHGLSFNTNSTWFFGMPSGSSVHWRFKILGTAADGGSDYTYDDTYPYSWGGETEPVNTRTSANTGNDPWCDANGGSGYECPNYMSHLTYDRWGVKGLYSHVASPVGAAVWDLDSKTFDMSATSTGQYIQHHDWNGWSDYNVSSRGAGNTTYLDDLIWLQKYDDGASETAIAYTHILYNNDGSYVGSTYEYQSLARPSQSPDGTKVAFHSTFLNPKTGTYDDQPDVFLVVAYWPYPPEISAATATGGEVTITTWWNLGTTPRGYTARGWPNQSTDDPPPPREIKEFRLWRSADKSTWTPIKTFSYDIWDKYDFSDGTWNIGTEASNTWSTTDSVADGTYYYAVTSLEHSGLESHALSNIYSITVSSGSGTGAQDTVYPASPGADSNFYSSFNSNNESLIRYYNIYAEDGSAPSVSQTNRIASIPISVDYNADTNFDWVDWLGKTDSTTEYVVTAVDYQGNESSAISGVTVTHKKSPATADGQYTIEWTSDYGITPAITGLTISQN